jgi:hypothetical protein
MPKITEMYAFVMVDGEEDDEGIIGFKSQTGEWLPMVGADMERVKSLIPIANMLSRELEKPYKILRFKLDGEMPKP